MGVQKRKLTRVLTQIPRGSLPACGVGPTGRAPASRIEYHVKLPRQRPHRVSTSEDLDAAGLLPPPYERPLCERRHVEFLLDDLELESKRRMVLEPTPPHMRMSCSTKLREAILTSFSVVCLFYVIDLGFHKLSVVRDDATLARVEAIARRYGIDPVVYTQIEAARNANALVMRLDNQDAILREIVSSRREGAGHVDSAINFYQYKLGLERVYWENKHEVLGMRKRLNVLNEEQVPAEDPELIQITREFWIHPPSPQPYNLESVNMSDASMGQSELVDSLLNGLRDGFFVEAGALDGETRSNTLFFERERGWTGLLVEPGPGNYRILLSKHRKAYMSPACLGDQPYPVDTLFHKGRNRGRLLDRREAFDWVTGQHMKLHSTEVQCFPLVTLLLALNRTQVDYLSLDVEGDELDVLRAIPFHRVNITVLTVEFKHAREGKDAIRVFMDSQGYALVAELSRKDNLANDYVFLRRQDADESFAAYVV